MEKKHTFIGAVCGIMTGVCWGSSAVISEFLFQKRGMQSDWFVAVRLFFSGVIMLLLAYWKNSNEIKMILKDKKAFLRTCVTGIFGTMLFQMFYYGTVQRSNAGTATVLQYLCPIMVMLYVCLKKRILPSIPETIAVIFAVGGIFLVSTHGNVHVLVLTPETILWGVSCAFFMMLCTVLPEPLYHQYTSQTVTALALFVGGITSTLWVRPWSGFVALKLTDIFFLSLAILIGGVISYGIYGVAIKRIGSSKASLFACSEIVTATTLSFFFLGTNVMWIDMIGIVLVVLGIILVVKGNKI